jgi:hypothetical protein
MDPFLTIMWIWSTISIIFFTCANTLSLSCSTLRGGMQQYLYDKLSLGSHQLPRYLFRALSRIIISILVLALSYLHRTFKKMECLKDLFQYDPVCNHRHWDVQRGCFVCLNITECWWHCCQLIASGAWLKQSCPPVSRLWHWPLRNGSFLSAAKSQWENLRRLREAQIASKWTCPRWWNLSCH